MVFGWDGQAEGVGVRGWGLRGMVGWGGEVMGKERWGLRDAGVGEDPVVSYVLGLEKRQQE